MSKVEIIQGNCIDCIDDILMDVKNPIIVTDPPFNVGYHYSGYNDKMPKSDYYNMLSDLVNRCPSVVIHYPEALHELSIKLHKAPERVISWVYPSNTQRQHRDIAFYGVKPDMSRVREPYKNPKDNRIIALANRTGGRKMYDWVEINQVKNVSKEKTAHPCQMPLELMRKIVKLLPDNITVIDPFCGSGTTVLACCMEGIDSYGIEMIPEYVEIAKDRIRNFIEDVPTCN